MNPQSYYNEPWYSRAPFKAGDTVRCTELPPPYGGFGRYTLGKTYVIVAFDEGETGDMIGLVDDNGELNWAVWEHFELAQKGGE